MADEIHVRRVLALLRGINVGGNKRVPMAVLRELATGLGFGAVTTYIASGNLLLTSALPTPVIEAQLEAAIGTCFGFTVDVIARTAEAWHAHAAGSPYPEAERERPSRLYLGVAKRPLAAGAEATLRALCNAYEHVTIDGQALWFDHTGEGPRSKLTPTAFDRAAGSPVTMRNWRTVTKLAELTR